MLCETSSGLSRRLPRTVISPTKRYFVDNYSRMDLAPKSVLRDATTGKVIKEFIPVPLQ